MNDERRPPLKILLVTYEFTFSPFSGNGILARSLVKSLLDQECQVTLWCCRPANASDYSDHHHLEPPEISAKQAERLEIISTAVPEHLGWRRLDKGSAWEHFAWGSLENSDDEVRLLNAASTADAACVIDWTGSMAWQSLACHLQSSAPVLYLNFRVFWSGATSDDASEREWYMEKEQDALDAASLVVALSEKDKQSLCELMRNGDEEEVPIKVLLPPLRGDMEELALLDYDDLQQYLPPSVSQALAGRPDSCRCLVTCVARLSPEKHVENFLDFVKANRTTLDTHDWIPFLAGSTADKDYADTIKEQLLNMAPNAIIMDSFLSPKALAAVFTKTAVNFHPCEYDAYGMTIVEAASFGVPSIVQGNGQVGATALVGNGASIEVNMMKEKGCWEYVTAILNNEQLLAQIGREAKKRALAWDECAYGKQLLEYVHAVTSS